MPEACPVQLLDAVIRLPRAVVEDDAVDVGQHRRARWAMQVDVLVDRGARRHVKHVQLNAHAARRAKVSWRDDALAYVFALQTAFAISAKA